MADLHARDSAVNVYLSPSDAAVPQDLHIPVYLGWHGEVKVEGQIFCVAGTNGIPVRMMYPQERCLQPGLPIELWLFPDTGWSDRYMPINVSRFFSHPERLRPRLPIVLLDGQEQCQEGNDWDEIDFMLVEDDSDTDLISFDEDEVNAV